MSNELRLFYEIRKAEVDDYFTFLESLNIDQNARFDISLNKDNENRRDFSLSETQIKIFKGNCFLMLYNVIEGTVNKSLEYLFDAINDSETSYCDLSQAIKSIWLKSEIKKELKDDMAKLSDFIDTVPEQRFAFDLRAFMDSNRSFFSSGNLDSRSIRKDLAPRLGMIFDEREGKLQEIKIFRNMLAHGEKSFVEIAKEKTYADILPYKDLAFNYLDKYLQAVERYVTDEEYKK